MSEAALTTEALASRWRRATGAVWSGVLSVWAAVTGVAPHVLHHVGPLAGAAFLAGATGKLLFALVGFAASVPFLLRLHRRFASWLVPALALSLMAGAFTVSTFVIGPALISEPAEVQDPLEHIEHHP